MSVHIFATLENVSKCYTYYFNYILSCKKMSVVCREAKKITIFKMILT